MREFSPGVSWHAPYGTKAGTDLFCNTEFFCFVASARSKCKALVEKHDSVISLPDDTNVTVVQPPNPANKDKKTPALLLFGIDVNNNPNILMLIAAYHVLGSFQMDRENKQSLGLPTWNVRNHIAVHPQNSQSVDAFVANTAGSDWVEDLLPDDMTREGMKKYFVMKRQGKTHCTDGQF
jgi:hypothetical protein